MPASAQQSDPPVLLNRTLAVPSKLPVDHIARQLYADAEREAAATSRQASKATDASTQTEEGTTAGGKQPQPSGAEHTGGGVSDQAAASGNTPATSTTGDATGVGLASVITTTDPRQSQPDGDQHDKQGDEKSPVDLAACTVLGIIAPELTAGGAATVLIDNDEQAETNATIKYEELPTDDGRTRVKTGARFPVVIMSEISSKTAKLNDPIQARLKYDLKIGDRLIAPKGSPVVGHLNYVLHARSTMHSLLSPERWYRNSGTLGIAFDEIINDKGEHLPLKAQPARQARVVKNKGEGRELGINHNGQVTGPWSQQLKYKAVRIGLNAALSPAGVFSFGAMPVALGVMGAACPSFAFMKPVGLNVRHRRIKGFAWGFLSGIPGSWLIEDTVVKGQEAIIKPGDEFLVEFEHEFTGEPATDAQVIPGATTKVHGQIVSGDKSSKKKKR
jgi:hypothetical protein